jgi:hypothetical protein
MNVLEKNFWSCLRIWVITFGGFDATPLCRNFPLYSMTEKSNCCTYCDLMSSVHERRNGFNVQSESHKSVLSILKPPVYILLFRERAVWEHRMFYMCFTSGLGPPSENKRMPDGFDYRRSRRRFPSNQSISILAWRLTGEEKKRVVRLDTRVILKITC